MSVQASQAAVYLPCGVEPMSSCNYQRHENVVDIVDWDTSARWNLDGLLDGRMMMREAP